MFSDGGNEAIHALVTFALTAKLSCRQVREMLEILAADPSEDFFEATDTAVRESVYAACNFI